MVLSVGRYGCQLWYYLHLMYKPVLSDHIKQDIFLALQIGGCLLLYESHLSEKPNICLVVQVALHRFDCSFRQFFTWLIGLFVTYLFTILVISYFGFEGFGFSLNQFLFSVYHLL